MNSLYQLAAGPLMWAAFCIFFLGISGRFLFIVRQIIAKEKFIVSYMSWKYALRSIFHWLTPFGAASWRNHPVFTLVTFAFHLCLLSAPLFLSAHVVMWEHAWGIVWWALPDTAALFMSAIVLAGCLFFFTRRIVLPEVRHISTARDYLLLLLVVMPFLTGIGAYFQWYGYPVWTLLHILSGQVLLVAIPFTRLSHMLFFWFTRAYAGSEFGSVRYSQDW